MLVVLPFHAGDKDQAVRLAGWIRELGGVKEHSCLVLCPPTTDGVGVVEPLREAFGHVFGLILERDEPGWPQGPNFMWHRMGVEMSARPQPEPWLWLEPDAVPLVPTWLDQIAAEYKTCGKPFMGDRTEVVGVAPHMSGVAVYPAMVCNHLERITDLFPPPGGQHYAWDLVFANQILPKAHFTKLIHHVRWLDPVRRTPPLFKDAASLSHLRPGAVLFHHNRNGDLIDRLREARGGVSPTRSVLIGGEIAGSSPAPAIASVQTRERVIHTYPVPVEGRDDAALVALWKEQWEAKGWATVVLGESDAKAHRLYDLAQRAWAVFPTVNNREYERACWNRWLAMSAVGGGWMSDYDVMPMGNLPSGSGELQFFSKGMNDPVVPCLVWGTKDGYESAIYHFLNFKTVGLKHFSDMIALEGLPADFNHCVKECGEDGWEKADAVHFSTHRMRKAGYTTKPEWIRGILTSKPTVFDALHVATESMTDIADGCSGASLETRRMLAGKGRIRSMEQVKADKERMAKVRAGIKRKLAGVV